MNDISILIHGHPVPPAPSEDVGQRVPAKRVAAWAGVSLRTIDRWLNTPELAFPKPAAVINGRRYWSISDLLAWDHARQAGAMV